MRWLSPATRTGRFLAFYIVLAIPLLRLLVRAHYEPWRFEVLVVLALFAVPCLLLALLPGGTKVFFGLLVPWAALFAVSSVQADLAPTFSLSWVLGGLMILIGAAAAVFRGRFPLLMGILLAGMLVGEGALQVAGGDVFPASPGLPPGSGLSHAIYLVLDEQTGIAGFPQQIPECAEAAGIWLEILHRQGFTVYPNAYSNYNATEQSLSSVLNDDILTHGMQFLRRNGVIGGNVLFAKAAAAGMDLATYQPESIRFNNSRHRYLHVREYDPHDVSAIREAAASGSERVWHIGVWYLMLHRPLAAILRSHFPRTADLVRAGPLAIRRIWPRRILQDILEAERPTLFFAHLLAPHYPYVFGARGAVRPFSQWSRPRTFSKAGSDQRYRAYCEQSTYLARQVDEFLAELQRAGMLRRAQVFIHGDHGARLRIATDLADPDSMKDLAERPTQEGLLDSFSTMLAVRLPGQDRPSVDPAKGSLLALFHKIGGRAAAEPGADIDKVYLIAPDLTIRRSIPILDYWKE